MKFLLSTPQTLIMIFSIFGGLILISLIIILIILKKKKNLSYAALKDEYEFAHNNLICDCKTNLNRIKLLGKSDPKLYKASIDCEKQYNDILNARDKQVEAIIQKIEKNLTLKNYSAKDVKNLEKECVIQLDALKKSVSLFATSLNLYLIEDNDLTDQCAKLKTRRRQLDEYFSEHSQELEPVKKSYDIISDHMNKLLISIREKQDKAMYKEAKESSEELTQIIIALEGVIQQLPLFVTTITKVLPRKFTQIENKYNFMIESDFDLSYTSIEKKMKDVKKQIDNVSEKIYSFDLSNMKDDVEKIQTDLNYLSDALENEEKAKKTVLEKKNNQMDDVFKYEKEHGIALKELAEYKNVYILDTQTVSSMVSLDKDIEKIAIIKRELEEYKAKAEKKPYSLIVRKDEELQKEMDKINNTMKDYNSYLLTLKDRCEEIYQALRVVFQDLLVIEYNLSSFGLEKFTLSYKNVLDDIKTQLRQFFKDITTPPIDVSALSEKFQQFKNTTSQVFKVIDSKIQEGQKAETALMYANEFRMDFTDCDNLLKQAETAFDSGNFTLCLNLARDSIKQWNV